MTRERLAPQFLSLILLLAPAAATAATTTVGDVDARGGDLTVGFASNSFSFGFGQLFVNDDPIDPNDPPITVNEQYGRLVVGNEELTIGEVSISGSGATVTGTDSGTSNAAVTVGEAGTGRLTVSGGAALVVSNLSDGTLEIGEQPTGYGVVTVEGRSAASFPSRLVVAENVVVGGQGVGELAIRGGALVYHTDLNSARLTIGESATGVGLVTLEGAGTLWQAPELVEIGVVDPAVPNSGGVGELRIGAGATFDADNGLLSATEAVTVGVRGYVNLQGGRFLTQRTTVDGRLGGQGWVTGPLTVSQTGLVSAGAGEKLRVFGAVENNGLVDVTGTPEQRAEIEFNAAVTIPATTPPVRAGRVAVADGVVRFAEALTNNGTLASTGGDTDFHGDITNGANGLIAVGGESHATFYGAVDNTLGTISVGAGSTALFLSDLSLGPFSTLAISVDETALTQGFDTPVQVLGSLALSGPISLELDGGFTPAEGDQIPLIEASGGLSDISLSTQSFAPLESGLSWEIVPTQEGLVAQVVAAPVALGDYNESGRVDAADYVIARDQGGPGGIAEWRANFGDALPNGPLLAQAVPEPTTACLALALAPLVTRRRR